MLYRLTYEFEFEKSLDILSSLGVININYDRKLPGDLHELQISELKKCLTFMYGKQYKLEENQKLLFYRGVVTCSEFGNQLLDVII